MMATFAAVKIRPENFWKRLWLRWWPWGHMNLQTKVLKNTAFLEVKLEISEELSEQKQQRRILSALKRLRQQHEIHRIAIDPQWQALAEQAWLLPVSCRKLWPALAAKIMLCRMKTEGLEGTKTVVRLRAKRADRDVLKCARQLARRVRSLQVEIPVGGQAVKEMLYEEFGIAPASELPQDCIRRELVFEGGCADGADALRLEDSYCGGEEGFVLYAPKWARKQRPVEISETLYAAMLWQAGILSAEEVVVSDKKTP